MATWRSEIVEEDDVLSNDAADVINNWEALGQIAIPATVVVIPVARRDGRRLFTDLLVTWATEPGPADGLAWVSQLVGATETRNEGVAYLLNQNDPVDNASVRINPFPRVRSATDVVTLTHVLFKTL